MKPSSTPEYRRAYRIALEARRTEEEREARYQRRKEYFRQLYLKKREIILARNKKWRDANREYWNQLHIANNYYRTPEEMKERRQRYNREHPERVKAWKARRRARQRGAVGTFTQEQWKARIEYYGWRCRYCRCDLTPQTVVIDHAIPLIRGGTNWPANLVPSCTSCNQKKYTQTLFEFLQLVTVMQTFKRRSRPRRAR